MADIELVIKIPENIYKYVQITGSVNMLDTQQIANAIFDGKLLPKGHGRLIDADDLLAEINQFDYYDNVKEAPTIIEADKAESEDKE